MLRILRTYRTVALLTAFALVTTAFAPLSAVCGMDLSESMPAPDAPMTQPCYEMGGMTLDASTSMEHGSSGDSDASVNAMFMLSCCVAQSPTAPKTERVAKLTAQVTEVVPETIASPSSDVYRQVAADESPPLPSVSLHLLLGHFLI